MGVKLARPLFMGIQSQLAPSKWLLYASSMFRLQQHSIQTARSSTNVCPNTQNLVFSIKLLDM